MGTLGDSTLVSKSSPVQIGGLTNWYQVSCAYTFSMAIKTDGTLWTWGSVLVGGYGELGLSDILGTYSSPVQIGTLTNWKQVSCAESTTGAVKTDGTLWTWGRNASGVLGTNATAHRSSPTQIGTLTNWKQVSCGGQHMVATKKDGTLWAWGNNYNGRVGDNSTVTKSSPVQVGTETNWKKIDVGRINSLAVR